MFGLIKIIKKEALTEEPYFEYWTATSASHVFPKFMAWPPSVREGNIDFPG